MPGLGWGVAEPSFLEKTSYMTVVKTDEDRELAEKTLQRCWVCVLSPPPSDSPALCVKSWWGVPKAMGQQLPGASTPGADPQAPCAPFSQMSASLTVPLPSHHTAHNPPSPLSPAGICLLWEVASDSSSLTLSSCCS